MSVSATDQAIEYVPAFLPTGSSVEAEPATPLYVSQVAQQGIGNPQPTMVTGQVVLETQNSNIQTTTVAANTMPVDDDLPF